MNQRLVHDVAYATALHLFEGAAGCVRDEKRQQLFDEIYRIVHAGIEAYAEQSERLWKRLYGNDPN